jgi:hypothetical protein
MDSLAIVGVEEHVWRPTCCGGKYVTVIVDLKPVRDSTGSSRLNSPGIALDSCRQRVQQQTPRHRQPVRRPALRKRRALHADEQLLKEKQQKRLDAVVATRGTLNLTVTWAS